MIYTILVSSLISATITLGLVYISHRLGRRFRQHLDQLASYQDRLSEDTAALNGAIDNLKAEIDSARLTLLLDAEKRLQASLDHLRQEFQEQAQAEVLRKLKDVVNEELESALEELSAAFVNANVRERDKNNILPET